MPENPDFVFCMGDESFQEEAAIEDHREETVAQQKARIKTMDELLKKSFNVPPNIGLPSTIPDNFNISKIIPDDLNRTYTHTLVPPGTLIQTPAQAQEAAENALRNATLKKEPLPNFVFSGEVTSLKIGDVDLGGGWTLHTPLKLTGIDNG